VDTSHGAIAAYSSKSFATVAADSGVATLGGFLQQPAEFDARLLLGLGGGLEADLAPGERIGSDVYGDTE
jgi:hypothetical protein